MKVHMNTSLQSLISLPLLYTFSIHVNKYILSVLGFAYPTVFQGWQTLVTVVLMRVLMSANLSPLSWSSFRSHMPLFVCFVATIVAGSKALSTLPVPVFVAVSNIAPILKNIFNTFHVEKKNLKNLSWCFLCLLGVISMFFIDPILSKMDVACFWLLLHVFFLGAQSAVDVKAASSELNSFDKLFYSNLFSVIVLAPSSLYLEEAFQALHFQERRQVGFLIGCIFSGVFGTLVSLLSVYCSDAPVNALALSKVISCFLSPFILPCLLSGTMWTLVTVSTVSVCFLPADDPSLVEALDSMKLKPTEEV